SGPRGGAAMKIEVKFNVERMEILHADLRTKPSTPAPAPKNLARYLKPDRFIPLDGATKTLALKVTAGKTGAVDKARAIYEYGVGTIKHDKSGTDWGRGDLKTILEKKAGNCTDLNTVFTALSRASGIAARQVNGFKVPKGPPEGTLTGMHCWAEF